MDLKRSSTKCGLYVQFLVCVKWTLTFITIVKTKERCIYANKSMVYQRCDQIQTCNQYIKIILSADRHQHIDYLKVKLSAPVDVRRILVN